MKQHMRRVERKIAKFKKKGRKADGLLLELAYCKGDKERPTFKTGYAARSIGERRRAVVAPEK
tara:strand:- start:3573 stop:3761 length:189 start_codon:yes stop_codon:yes gene_type:complete